MKAMKYSGLWSALLIFIIISCEKDQKHNQENIISGKLVTHSECKSNLKSYPEKLNALDNQSCINYSFDNINNKLTIHHVNAAFNCCADSLYCIISMTDHIITVKECEKLPLCNCDCLFDLDIEINGINSGIYWITFDEPYVDDESKISFEINLINKKVGSFCVQRNLYPWSI